MAEYKGRTKSKVPAIRSVYDYLVYKNGSPAKYAKKLSREPAAMLADFEDFFDGYEGLKIAAISDTDGSYAIPMACMGAETTVFGTLEEARGYVLKTAGSASVSINYEARDILEEDGNFPDGFDAVIIKRAVIHYFYDIETFFKIICSMLKKGGRLICIDFHPFYQNGVCCVGDHRFSHILRQFPEESEKRYALTDILQAISLCGLKITSFDEETVSDELTSRTRACLTAEKN